ncbi:hypothetical protein BC936DRAFT_142979 [Jimgerdemannia flammicorona]|uniref:dUTPase-like domain-containing protein n=1 Tax=Jimgerdemannia flammicorona TaxID=994334 RepID=A0A432ZZI6_9FUNG|nr:hypothetical protein BC936DRAFT_142979 [Jimgerdemannia flammicorona]
MVRVTHKYNTRIRNNNDIQLPSRGTSGSAGLDLYSPEDGVVEPNSLSIVDTQLKMALPAGYCGLMFSRSSQFGMGEDYDWEQWVQIVPIQTR